MLTVKGVKVSAIILDAINILQVKYWIHLKRPHHINWKFSGVTQHFIAYLTAIIAYILCHNLTNYYYIVQIYAVPVKTD